jgi:hypothetical protein
MTSYVKKMLEEFLIKFKGKSKCPSSKNLFKVDDISNKLPQNKIKTFHMFVMKGMFLCKQARQDLLPSIVFLNRGLEETAAHAQLPTRHLT